MSHPDFAQDPLHYIRPFLLIQKDLINLFDYIEPSDLNLATYSYRVHELLLRACVEVEANFKAILRENSYSDPEKKKPADRNWNITNYKVVERSHFLSLFRVTLPEWNGTCNTVQPFENWVNSRLPWYDAYNGTKHDRHKKFADANLGNLINAVSGLLVLLSSQFYTEDFSSSPSFMLLESSKIGIGGYFSVEFPDIPEHERYDFDHEDIKKADFGFDKYPY